jgi:hypothetical protein
MAFEFMLTCHELFGFMPETLAAEILETSSHADKPTYQSVLSTVAAARKVRPEFLRKKPRTERHRDMAVSLAHPRLDETAALLLRQWLMTAHAGMLEVFLNKLGIAHRQGVVEQFPAAVEDGPLRAAVEELLAQYPEKTVSIYLHSLMAMKLVSWPNLAAILQQEPRIQLG